MSNRHTDSQDDLIKFIDDPENIKKAVEGSMEKRQAVMDSQGLEGEDDLKDTITSIIYGADWKERGLEHAFKPDVEAAMDAFTKATAQAQRELLDRLEAQKVWLAYDDSEGEAIDAVPVSVITQELERIAKEEK